MIGSVRGTVVERTAAGEVLIEVGGGLMSGSLALLVAEQINKQWAEVKKNFVHIQTLQNSTESTPQDSTTSPPESSPTTSPDYPLFEKLGNDVAESNSLPT